MYQEEQNPTNSQYFKKFEALTVNTTKALMIFHVHFTVVLVKILKRSFLLSDLATVIETKENAA